MRSRYLRQLRDDLSMETTYNHKTYHSQLQAHRLSFITSLQVEALYL
jgi:hypothetical protein